MYGDHGEPTSFDVTITDGGVIVIDGLGISGFEALEGQWRLGADDEVVIEFADADDERRRAIVDVGLDDNPDGTVSGVVLDDPGTTQGTLTLVGTLWEGDSVHGSYRTGDLVHGVSCSKRP